MTRLAPVENEDVATFTATFANGAVGTFSASRVAHSLPDGLGFELFASTGSAAWNLHRPGEFEISTAEGRAELGGPRRVIIGPDHPYIRGGLPMDAGGVGHGVADLFVYQTRAFLDQIAGIGDLGPLPELRRRPARPARRGRHRRVRPVGWHHRQSRLNQEGVEEP